VAKLIPIDAQTKEFAKVTIAFRLCSVSTRLIPAFPSSRFSALKRHHPLDPHQPEPLEPLPLSLSLSIPLPLLPLLYVIPIEPTRRPTLPTLRPDLHLLIHLHRLIEQRRALRWARSLTPSRRHQRPERGFADLVERDEAGALDLLHLSRWAGLIVTVQLGAGVCGGGAIECGGGAEGCPII